MAQPLNEKTQQPQAIPPMTISTGDPHQNVKNLPFTDGKREWSNGLFDCFGDCGTCVHAWFCPCMVYSKNKHRVEYLNQNGRPDPDSGGSGVDGDCAMHCCLTVLFNGGFILQVCTLFYTRGSSKLQLTSLVRCPIEALFVTGTTSKAARGWIV
ncbi:hypothetical protein JOM56_011778 [Amanita muscaria]